MNCAFMGSLTEIPAHDIPSIARSDQVNREDVGVYASFRPENGNRSVQRFLSVIPTPAPSIKTNEESRSGLVVIASM